MKQYNLSLDTEQLQLIQSALDLYSRIQTGQITELLNSHSGPLSLPIAQSGAHDLEPLLLKVKAKIFPELGENYSSWSINSPKHVPESARIAYDTVQVIRHKLSWDQHPEGGTGVSFSNPIASSSKDLPTLTDKI